MEKKICVVGAGIVGISCAIALQRDGHEVVLIDKTGPAAGASFGNAGAIVNGSCLPTATPGIILNALKMLISKGPLSISPRHIPSLTPWLIKFVLQSSQKNYQHSATHLHALTAQASSSWQQLLSSTDCSDLFKNTGWLKLYETTKCFNQNLAARELMKQKGTHFEVLNATEIQDIEPNLASIFKHGVLQADCYFITNPERMLQQLTSHFIANGGVFNTIEVTDINLSKNRPEIKSLQGDFYPQKIILAAGACSTRLTKGLNFKAPLEAERGYHLMMPTTTDIKRPIVNADKGFVICPMETGLRLTSQVELASVDAPADYTKIRAFMPQVKRMLPSALLQEQSCWMGARPSLPDSLPIISQWSEQVYFAFGHQHLGLTLGPITGELIADLVAQRPTKIDLAAYRHDRF
ncbi:MAG: glycine/D-amino acid oxidase-like deaminating enzyme [Oceanospirillaceae bacterium]|jgi:glycine/D-amino acid oxidase-like deaminating enzyme